MAHRMMRKSRQPSGALIRGLAAHSYLLKADARRSKIGDLDVLLSKHQKARRRRTGGPGRVCRGTFHPPGGDRERRSDVMECRRIKVPRKHFRAASFRPEAALATWFNSCSDENGQAARSPLLLDQPLNHPSRRLRPLVPWWWRAAGFAARDGVARAGSDARRDRGRASTAVPPDR